MDEKTRAFREGMEAHAEEVYFCNRKNLDTASHRRVFDAGFERGWDAAQVVHPFGIPEDRIRQIAEGMPGGLDGFMKGWGWLQFARAIEQEQGINP